MSIVKEEHKATLRKWHEELQEKRGNRASLRRSTTVNDVCLSEGFRSLLMQTHTLWKIEAQEWRFTALALVAAVAANSAVLASSQSAERKGEPGGKAQAERNTSRRSLSAPSVPAR